MEICICKLELLHFRKELGAFGPGNEKKALSQEIASF
jgi:hypothetical protein